MRICAASPGHVCAGELTHFVQGLCGKARAFRGLHFLPTALTSAVHTLVGQLRRCSLVLLFM